MRRGIIAGGNWVMDHVKLVDRWPEQDTLAFIHGHAQGGGGGPYNVLVDIARFGAGVPLEGIGLLGDDADGRTLLASLRRLRIGTRQMRVTRAAPTSSTDVMSVRATGRRTFFHDAGTNALLDDEAFDFTKTRARIFLLAYLLLLDRLDRPDRTYGTVAACRHRTWHTSASPTKGSPCLKADESAVRAPEKTSLCGLTNFCPFSKAQPQTEGAAKQYVTARNRKESQRHHRRTVGSESGSGDP